MQRMKSGTEIQGQAVLLFLAAHGFAHLLEEDPIPTEEGMFREVELLRAMLGKKRVTEVSLVDFGTTEAKLAKWPFVLEAVRHGLAHLQGQRIKETEIEMRFSQQEKGNAAFRGDLRELSIRFFASLIADH